MAVDDLRHAAVDRAHFFAADDSRPSSGAQATITRDRKVRELEHSAGLEDIRESERGGVKSVARRDIGGEHAKLAHSDLKDGAGAVSARVVHQKVLRPAVAGRVVAGNI